ncbi:non-structural maintenance of chromosomes element 4 homolog A-like [Prunus yedoensis var. nudiflora]|uniref:Non-structural maintenance of chromosomes element 4 homolog A-like n=1 Tax=Prunus yedoensis var. nudiflora TaxID=2094558 RepID=A0A314XLY8_PRUYE|nr:non-structural maintenance of chromosomes element 4 homolog A-like [Prunus yedoensis var. nudiflora]
MERELAGSSSRGKDKMEQPQAVADRRALRSRYFTVKTLIHELFVTFSSLNSGLEFVALCLVAEKDHRAMCFFPRIVLFP